MAKNGKAVQRAPLIFVLGAAELLKGSYGFFSPNDDLANSVAVILVGLKSTLICRPFHMLPFLSLFLLCFCCV